MSGRVRSALGEAIFRRVAGRRGPENRARIHGTPGDRWFSHDDPISRVHGDAAMFVGGLRAVLLQTLHPAAMWAVEEHSGYRGDLWGRLARTSTFLAETTFGTVEHAERAIEVVRAVHERVRGTLPDGRPYAASDPHLLLWVHVAEVDSFLAAHQRHGARPLSDEEADTYVAQTALVAERLGVVDPPRTRAELTAALESFRPELEGSPPALAAVRFLLLHPDLPALARPAYAALAAAAISLLPQWAREPLRLPSLPLLERTAGRRLGDVMTRTIRWAMRPPPAAASWVDVHAGAGPGR